ncbi:50S ribosomal protein L10 [Candidatus Nomurabacteria bacterium RIFCSPLOWO2_01_FULL_33_17]|uniref:Large ribosomal subunit protein uL10 n=1 Tax=Candidatus Nomurabacteria bacterium RIFCSPLOWO2_01_FULL_33_17 TaxID=1801764 RepID=A0A1F6WQH1_9BACT|nr:MAG: 50S ribosomal protein L10 [Candidatus Nomurabacteria bacterium RIFCSPLOWO2_01_FULL_33_17]
MAITLAQKQSQTNNLTEILKGKQCVVFVEFSKFNVFDTNEFRRKLENANITYTVIKKTLAKRSMSDMNYAGEHPELAGQIGIATSVDPIAAAREVFEFAKTHKGVVSIVGGVYENTYLGSDAMLAIATIPGRDVLYTQLVSVLIAPIQKFATALAEIAKAKA